MRPPPPPGGLGGQGSPGTPAGPGGKDNRKVITAVAAAVAVLLLAGTGVFFLTRGDDGTKNESRSGGSSGQEGKGEKNGTPSQPKAVQAEELFTLDPPKVKEMTSAAGAWATKAVYAKSSLNEILLIDLKTNEKKGAIPLKGGVCAATKEMTEDHKVGLVVKETISSGAPCSRMVVADLHAGKLVMDEKMPHADTIANDNVALSGTTVASAWQDGSAGYDIRTGKRLWSATPSTCRDMGYRGGKQLYAVVECGDPDEPQIAVQRLDPDQKGKAVGKYQLPKGASNVRVASTDPLVLVSSTTGDRGYGATDIWTVGEGEKLKARIPLGERYQDPCGGQEVDACHAIAVGDDAVYLANAEREGEGPSGGERANDVVALDLASGNPKWRSPSGPDRGVLPFRMEGRNVIGYKPPTYDKSGEIVSIEPSKGKQTTLLKMPNVRPPGGERHFDVRSQMTTPLVYAHGRFFLDDKIVSEPRESDELDPPVLARGFGPK